MHKLVCKPTMRTIIWYQAKDYTPPLSLHTQPGKTLEQKVWLQMRLETPRYALLHGPGFYKRPRSKYHACILALWIHYGEVIMSTMVSQIIGVSIRLFNRLFRHLSKKQTSKLRATGLCEGNPPVTGGFPHKGPVARKCFHLTTSSCH